MRAAGLIGEHGERLCHRVLVGRGWQVENLNHAHSQHPNSDLLITRGQERHHLQVKSSGKMASQGRGGYVTGGSVTPAMFSGGSIFNKSTKAPPCGFVIFLSEVMSDARYFILPVQDAEGLFRRNIDAYFLSPKLNGGTKSLRGQCDIFVGRGSFPHARIVPD